MHITDTTQDPGKKPQPAIAFATETEARTRGWHAITAPIYCPAEADIAESIRATLSGDAPGSTRVEFATIGTPERFQFARRREDLHGPEVEPVADNHIAGVAVAEPMLLADAA